MSIQFLKQAIEYGGELSAYRDDIEELLDRVKSLEAGQQQQLMLHKAECAGLEAENTVLANDVSKYQRRFLLLGQRLVDAMPFLEQGHQLDHGERWRKDCSTENCEWLKLIQNLATATGTTRYCVKDLGHKGECLYGSFIYLGDDKCSAESPAKRP